MFANHFINLQYVLCLYIKQIMLVITNLVNFHIICILLLVGKLSQKSFDKSQSYKIHISPQQLYFDNHSHNLNLDSNSY